jgi:hypothetical protein
LIEEIYQNCPLEHKYYFANFQICEQMQEKKSNYVYVWSYALVSFPGFCLYDKVKKCKEADLICNSDRMIMRMIPADELIATITTKT